MQLQAILHIPLSSYAFAMDEKTLVIRIRTAKNDIKKCELFYGDRCCPYEPIEVTEIEMKKVASDELFDYFEVEIENSFTRVCYYFRLSDETTTKYYSANGIKDEIVTNRNQYFQFPYIRREDIPDIPDWAKDVVMYQIFPDSFASSKREITGDPRNVSLSNGMVSKSHLGGTLLGIMENLDYIEEMGFNCIYINPIFKALEYHKYDTMDYYEIDPCFGTKEQLIDLVKEAHSRGIRVILDGVFNHCGPGFFAFQDVLKNEEKSKYKDWFYKLSFPIEYKDPPNYETFAYVKEMPKMNTGNPEVVEYFCNVGKYWIKEADIDGWRLDVANEINHNFWREFRKAVRSVKKDALLIAEIWEDSEKWLQGDQFDSTMNYTFSYNCKEFFAEQKITALEFDEKMEHMLMRYPRRVTQIQMNLLDSHDVPRFLSYCDGKEERLKLAIFYMLMSVGIPSIFYGDECLLSGMTEIEYRRKMDWTNSHEDMKAYIKKWIQERKLHKALTRGNYKMIEAVNGAFVFERTYKEEKIIVVINNSNEEYEFKLKEEWQGRLYDMDMKEQVVGSIHKVKAMDGQAYLLK